MAQLTQITRRIDATLKDWVLVNGERQLDDGLLSQVYFFVALEYNSSPAFPGWGSKFHQMDKVTEDFDVLLQQEAERCLKPLTDSGVIKNLNPIVYIVDRAGRKRPPDDIQNVRDDEKIMLDIEYEDAAGRPGKNTFEVS